VTPCRSKKKVADFSKKPRGLGIFKFEMLRGFHLRKFQILKHIFFSGKFFFFVLTASLPPILLHIKMTLLYASHFQTFDSRTAPVNFVV